MDRNSGKKCLLFKNHKTYFEIIALFINKNLFEGVFTTRDINKF